MLNFHNVIILIKSVVSKNKNNYYYNMRPVETWDDWEAEKKKKKKKKKKKIEIEKIVLK